MKREGKDKLTGWNSYLLPKLLFYAISFMSSIHSFSHLTCLSPLILCKVWYPIVTLRGFFIKQPYPFCPCLLFCSQSHTFFLLIRQSQQEANTVVLMFLSLIWFSCPSHNIYPLSSLLCLPWTFQYHMFYCFIYFSLTLHAFSSVICSPPVRLYIYLRRLNASFKQQLASSATIIPPSVLIYLWRLAVGPRLHIGISPGRGV